MPSVPRRPGRPSIEHQAAVARRLDLLRAELAVPVLGAAPATPAAPAAPAPAPEVPDLGHDEWWSASTRIPGVVDVVPVLAVEPDPAPAPDPAPVPGRHASRRRHDLVGALVPETLRGRVVLGPAQLTVVAVLICVGLAALAWSTVRSRPEPLRPDRAAPVSAPRVAGAAGAAPVLAVPSARSDVASVGASDSTVVADGPLTVDVAGRVHPPGIAVLASGARVVDAIAAAGGARRGVDLTPLNLARPLVDGEQIVVGVDPPPGVAAAALAGAVPPGATAGSAGVLVDLNTATDVELDTLPDVGPVTAASIIAWRAEHGGFTSVDELLEVDGIGEATLTRLAPHVTV